MPNIHSVFLFLLKVMEQKSVSKPEKISDYKHNTNGVGWWD